MVVDFMIMHIIYTQSKATFTNWYCEGLHILTKQKVACFVGLEVINTAQILIS